MPDEFWLPENALSLQVFSESKAPAL